jgi:3-hydroxyacyl-CoA dehydrogenase
MSKANYEVREALAPAAVVMAAARAFPAARAPDLRQAETDLQMKTLCETGSLAELPANDTLRQIKRVGIIGADAIGIAMQVLDADIPVTIFDTRREATVQAVATARAGYERLVTAGQLTADKRDRRMALLTGAANFHHLKDCDLILATLSSEMPAAEKLFRRLDDLVKPGTILVTNHTSSEIADIARFTRRPADVLGMRFPIPVVPLRSFDLVRASLTSEETFAAADALVKKIRKPGQ